MDGGTVYNLNIDSAIEQCLELVDDYSKITVDVLVCNKTPAPAETEGIGKTIANIERSRAIHKNTGSINTIQDVMRAHPEINYRYLVYFSNSDVHLGGIGELEFEGTKTWPLQVQGRTDAQTAINAGPSASFQSLLSDNSSILQ